MAPRQPATPPSSPSLPDWQKRSPNWGLRINCDLVLRLLQPALAPRCPSSRLSKALVAACLICLKAILLAQSLKVPPLSGPRGQVHPSSQQVGMVAGHAGLEEASACPGSTLT